MNWFEILLVPIAGGVVGFGVWYFQSRIEQLRSEQARLHDERRALYSAILDPYVRILTAMKAGKNVDNVVKHITSYGYRKIGFEFGLIAPDDVVKAYNSMMQFFFLAEGAGGIQPKDMLRHWGGFLLAIRRNLGNQKTTLDEKDMLRSWITDIDTLLP